MRILYITDTREIGGAERYLATLAEGAARAGHEILVLAPQAELVEWLRREAPAAQVRRAFDDAYHDAPSARDRLAALAGQLRELVGVQRSLHADVVHVNNGGWPGSDLCRAALMAARIAAIPRRLVTVHSDPWPRSRGSDLRVQAVADRFAWSAVSAVICPSDAVAGGLVERRGMPGHLARKIHYGVQATRPDAAEVRRLRARLAPRDEILVGMVSARPVPEKGYEVFLQALAREGHEGVSAVLVGRAPNDFRGRVDMLGLGDRVTLEGRRANVADYYAAMDVVVVPSTAEECMPYVILEAAAAGTPAFGSSLAGIPEAIVDRVTGRLFDPGAADQLARLIEQARVGREGLKAMGEAAHQRWRQDFSLDPMLDRTLAIYAG